MWFLDFLDTTARKPLSFHILQIGVPNIGLDTLPGFQCLKAFQIVACMHRFFPNARNSTAWFYAVISADQLLFNWTINSAPSSSCLYVLRVCMRRKVAVWGTYALPEVSPREESLKQGSTQHLQSCIASRPQDRDLRIRLLHILRESLDTSHDCIYSTDITRSRIRNSSLESRRVSSSR